MKRSDISKQFTIIFYDDNDNVIKVFKDYFYTYDNNRYQITAKDFDKSISDAYVSSKEYNIHVLDDPNEYYIKSGHSITIGNNNYISMVVCKLNSEDI